MKLVEFLSHRNLDSVSFLILAQSIQLVAYSEINNAFRLTSTPFMRLSWRCGRYKREFYFSIQVSSTIRIQFRIQTTLLFTEMKLDLN
jgi:hypothetical protein